MGAPQGCAPNGCAPQGCTWVSIEHWTSIRLEGRIDPSAATPLRAVLSTLVIPCGIVRIDVRHVDELARPVLDVLLEIGRYARRIDCELHVVATGALRDLLELELDAEGQVLLGLHAGDGC